MFATVRRYAGLSRSAVDAFAAPTGSLRLILESVPGWAGSQLIRTRDGVILVTVGEDETSLVESGRRVSAWLAAHVEDVASSAAPQVWAGEVLMEMASGTTEITTQK